MATSPGEETDEAPPEKTSNHDALMGGIALGVLLGVMAWWWCFPFPSGKQHTFVDFLLFFGREAVLVLFLLGALVFAVLTAIWRGITSGFSK